MLDDWVGGRLGRARSLRRESGVSRHEQRDVGIRDDGRGLIRACRRTPWRWVCGGGYARRDDGRARSGAS